MTKLDFLCLLPLLIVASAPIIMMLTITVSRNFKVTFAFSMVMFLAAIVSLFFVAPGIPCKVEPLLVMDGFSLLLLGVVFGVSLLITLISYLYFRNHTGEREEYFIILFIATLGASMLVMANHFVMFFLGLETLSIALYVMIAYLKYRDFSIEAGVKFLVIASVATAFLLFGMALVYAATGQMSFKGVTEMFCTGELSPVLIAGFIMMLAGIGFKLALVPFHMWTPDIYQGAPAPVSTYIATVSKAAILAVFIRFFNTIHGYDNSVLFVLISVIAILSMFTGNLLALKQTNFKRLLAYSSIAHMGYLMITLLTGTVYGVQAAIFYLVSYMITTLGAFGTISILSVCERDAEDMDDLKGMFWKNPRIAVVLTLTLLSLAGIPLTAGFMAKFYLVLEGVRTGFWLLAISLVINSVISLYYYLRVIKTMFTKTDSARFFALPPAGSIVLGIVLVGILLLGILPAFLTEAINHFISI